jgi:hypothetical protein
MAWPSKFDNLSGGFKQHGTQAPPHATRFVELLPTFALAPAPSCTVAKGYLKMKLGANKINIFIFISFDSFA